MKNIFGNLTNVDYPVVSKETTEQTPSASASPILVLIETVWAFMWLFSIGFVGLSFWQGVLALVIWPYYLGVTVAGLL